MRIRGTRRTQRPSRAGHPARPAADKRRCSRSEASEMTFGSAICAGDGGENALSHPNWNDRPRPITVARTDDADGIFSTRAHPDHSPPCSAFTRERDFDAQSPEDVCARRSRPARPRVFCPCAAPRERVRPIAIFVCGGRTMLRARFCSRRKRPAHRVWLTRDHAQVGACRGVGLVAALLPIPDCSNRNMERGRELLL
jgi:hypothetical protein